MNNIALTIWVLLTVLLGLFSCRDTPRDNPYDPATEVLLVEVLSPGDSSVFEARAEITFRVSATTGFDNAPAGKVFEWRSSISGLLSTSSEFTTDSLPPGDHRITVTVTDSLDRKGSKAIRVIILKVPDYGVAITTPPGDTAFIVGSTFTPAVREYVKQGTTIIGRLWTFGAGSGIPDAKTADPGPVVWNAAGTFSLIYQLVDNLGRIAADTLTVEVLSESVPPFVEITSPAADTAIVSGDSLRLEALEIKTVARIAHRGWIYPEGSGLEDLQDSLAVAGWRKFSTPGIFEIIYRVMDLLGVPAADTVRITVNDTLPPPIVVIIRPASDDTTVVAGDSIRFEGFLVPNQAPTVSRTWSYGAGSGIAADSLVQPGWRRFNNPGVFRVTFTASDLSGRSSQDSLVVRVIANQPPAASITTPTGNISIGNGVSLNFTATDSDPENRPRLRYWLWGTGSGITPSAADSLANAGSRAFNVNGNFTVSFNVVDDKGLRAADSLTVTVSNNQPPVARISSPSVDTTVAAWSRMVFTSNDSDPDGSIVGRTWSFDAASGVDGSGETGAATGPKYIGATGTFKIIHTVVDNFFASDADTLLLTVLANSRPTALIVSPVGLLSIARGDSLDFFGTDSDSDGTIALRVWTYGTGSGLAPDSTSAPDYRKFNTAGSFTVIYTVRDDRGGEVADSVQVTVAP